MKNRNSSDLCLFVLFLAIFLFVFCTIAFSLRFFFLFKCFTFFPLSFNCVIHSGLQLSSFFLLLRNIILKASGWILSPSGIFYGLSAALLSFDLVLNTLLLFLHSILPWWNILCVVLHCFAGNQENWLKLRKLNKGVGTWMEGWMDG